MKYFVSILLMFFSLTSVNASSTSCDEHSCLAVVDAGSTGSRVHIYAYDHEGNQITNIHEVSSKKIQPGIASVELNEASIHKYLNTLFADSQNKSIPVYFYATAGMRLLSNQKQISYYDKIKKWFSSQSNWKLLEAKTITGNEEGVFGWYAVNYGLGTLSSTELPYVGVMDTGGASVQVTFPITNLQSVNKEDLVDVTLKNQTVHLFVHSFLGLGQNELDHQFLDVPECFSNDYPLTNGSLAHGNLPACEKEIAVLINAVHHVNKIVKPVIESNPVSAWYGIGGIGYIVQTSPVVFENNEFTMNQLADKGNIEFCQKNWNTLNGQYSTNDYLYSSCLNTSYFEALVVDGYGINPNQPIHFFPSSANMADWTLGVVLRNQ